MLTGLYSASTAMAAARQRHEVTAHNLAHASVPGFRRLISSTQTFSSSLEGGESPVGHGVSVEPSDTDFTEGAQQSTGRSLDVAMLGDAFFGVTTPNGTAYTRNGVFFLQPDGALITADNYRVQDSAGADIQLPPDASPGDISIDVNGAIAVRGIPVGEIGTFAFEDNSKLARIGTTLFSPTAEAVPTESTARLQQGARESSNVSTIDELIQMITGMRHFEAAQKVLSSIDTAISKNTDPRSA